jgi:multiple sugar transport system ATP-binding protein
LASVTLEGVGKVYDEDVVAVSDLSLSIRDGEFVVFVGPSGCGKSTVLRMIAGLEDATRGRVFIGEDLVNGLAPRDRDVAMVFQSYALYPHMSVRENLAFALKLRKLDKAEISRRVEEAAKILGMESLLDRKPRALSGGQRQRVALGRAIVREPRVFLMDEPLSNLDAGLRVRMRTEIVKLHDRIGVTTIYVTHDQAEAMTMADRIVVLKDGVVQQVSSPQVLYERPANVFVAGFVGSPSMNLLRARLERESGGFAATFGRVRAPLPRKAAENLGAYAGKEVILGIRPEHLEDARLPKGAPGSATNTIKIEPRVVESVGSEKYVYFETPGERADRPGGVESIGMPEDSGSTMVARVSSDSAARRGEVMPIVIDTSRVRLFDPNTGEAVS